MLGKVIYFSPTAAHLNFAMSQVSLGFEQIIVNTSAWGLFMIVLNTALFGSWVCLLWCQEIRPLPPLITLVVSSARAECERWLPCVLALQVVLTRIREYLEFVLKRSVNLDFWSHKISLFSDSLKHSAGIVSKQAVKISQERNVAGESCSTCVFGAGVGVPPPRFAAKDMNQAICDQSQTTSTDVTSPRQTLCQQPPFSSPTSKGLMPSRQRKTWPLWSMSGFDLWLSCLEKKNIGKKNSSMTKPNQILETQCPETKLFFALTKCTPWFPTVKTHQ